MISAMETHDIRFPTSRELDGSDAMNPDPDYSAAYVVLRTETELEGHGFTFTIGRGNEVCRAAIDALAPMVAGQSVDDLGEFARRLTHDSQIRWFGSPARGSRTPTPRSSSRWVPTGTTTYGGWRWPGARSVTGSGSRSTRTSAGTWPRRSTG